MYQLTTTMWSVMLSSTAALTTATTSRTPWDTSKITRYVLVDCIDQSNAFKADLAQQHAHNEPLDDDHVTNAHQQAYQNNGASGMSANNLGAAAAMQVSVVLLSYPSLNTKSADP